MADWHVSRNSVGLYDITYHVFEVRIDATYHGRGGAVAVGVSAACEAERAYTVTASAMPWTERSSNAYHHHHHIFYCHLKNQ